MNDRSDAGSAPSIRDRIEEIFGLDLRSLALFRMSISALVLGDLVFRLPHLVSLYAESGLLSTDAALEVIGPGLYFSIHFLVRGSVVALGCVFALQLLAAIAMFVGYRTRIATAVCWYLLASLQVVEVYHLHLGGDTYLRMMLLWGALLPLGRKWSLDARRRAALSVSSVSSASSASPRVDDAAPREDPLRAYSWVTFALVSQFVLFYLVAGLHKNTPIWDDGDALYFMLHRDHLATGFASMLLELPWALTPLTYGTYWLEVLAPLMLILPFHTAIVRTVTIAVLVLFHVGLGVFLDIGPYPLMSIAPLTALLPTRFWQEWWPRFRGRGDGGAVGRARAGMASIGAPVAVQVFACLVVVYAFLYQMGEARLVTLPRPLVAVGSALRINQSYKMMKNIGTRSFWLIVDGRTVDGKPIDPFHRRPVSLEKPADIPATFRSFRWRQFILGSVAHVASGSREQILHHAFAEYICREWNAEHTGAERLERLDTVRGFETTHLDHVGPPEYAILWQHECGAPRERDAAAMSVRR